MHMAQKLAHGRYSCSFCCYSFYLYSVHCYGMIGPVAPTWVHHKETFLLLLSFIMTLDWPIWISMKAMFPMLSPPSKHEHSCTHHHHPQRPPVQITHPRTWPWITHHPETANRCISPPRLLLLPAPSSTMFWMAEHLQQLP